MPNSPTIVLVDRMSTPRRNLPAVAAALQRQVNEHFGLPRPVGWGITATVRAASKRWPAKPTEWQLLLLDQPDVAGALGYHDVTSAGMPIMKVFPLLDAQDGVEWSTTASHEILEALADPELVWCAQDPRGIMFAAEVGDPVQSERYLIDNIAVSNFVTPYYFAPPPDASKAVGKMDHMGTVKAPYEVRPGGYTQYFDLQHGWVSVDTPGVPKGRQDREGRRSRRAEKHRVKAKSFFARLQGDATPSVLVVDLETGGIPGVPLGFFGPAKSAT